MNIEFDRNFVIKLDNDYGVIAARDMRKERKTVLVDQKWYARFSEIEQVEIEEQVIDYFKQHTKSPVENAIIHIEWGYLGRVTILSVVIEPTRNIVQGERITIEDVKFYRY